MWSSTNSGDGANLLPEFVLDGSRSLFLHFYFPPAKKGAYFVCTSTVWRVTQVFMSTLFSHLQTAPNSFFCSNVQISKYLDVPNLRQIPSKSQNLWFLCQNLENSQHVRTGCFLSKFRVYSDLRQTSKYSNILHTSSYIRRHIPTIHLLTSYFPGPLWERGSQEMRTAPYRLFNFCQNIHLLTENARLEQIRDNLDEKQLQHKIKRGPSKSPPNSLQMGNLEGNIWTFEQIDELR